jgi:hypothetical protein
MVMDVERVNEIVDRINTIRGRVVVAPVSSPEASGPTTATCDLVEVGKERGPKPPAGQLLDSIKERLGALRFERIEPPSVMKIIKKDDSKEDEGDEEETEEEAEPDRPGEPHRIKKVKKLKKKKVKK